MFAEGEEVSGIVKDAPEQVIWERFVVKEGRGDIITGKVDNGPFPQSVFVPQTVIFPETAVLVKFRIIVFVYGGVDTGVTPAGHVQVYEVELGSMGTEYDLSPPPRQTIDGPIIGPRLPGYLLNVSARERVLVLNAYHQVFIVFTSPMQ